MPTTERVYMCKCCEGITAVDESGNCEQCGTPALVIPRNTANRIVWQENVDRMQRWCKAGRIMPEVEA